MENITVAQAAKMLGWDIDFLRVGLRQDKYPFGVASKAEGKRRYAYRIYPKALQDFMRGKLGKEMVL